MKPSKESNLLTIVGLIIFLVAAVMWSCQLMAGDRVWRFWYSEIVGNSRVCYYQGPNAPVLVIGVQERCPKTL